MRNLWRIVGWMIESSALSPSYLGMHQTRARTKRPRTSSKF
jgi:hypothetical protein